MHTEDTSSVSRRHLRNTTHSAPTGVYPVRIPYGKSPKAQEEKGHKEEG